MRAARFLAVLAILTLGTSVAQASPFAHIYGSFGAIAGDKLTGDVYMYGSYNQYVSVYIAPQQMNFINQSTWDNPDNLWMNGTQWYCVDLTATQGGTSWWMYHSNDPDLTTGPLSSGPRGTYAGVQRAAWLVNNYLSSAQAGDKYDRAGLQLAIWEAVYDGHLTTSSIGFTSGSFLAKNLNSTAVSRAQTMYAASNGQAGLAVYGDDSQNMMGDVPEPTTVTLLGVAILGAGIVAWRRRRQG